MKRMRKPVSILCGLALTVGCLGGCTSFTENQTTQTPSSQLPNDAFDQQVKQIDNWKAAENEEWELIINGSTAEIRLNNRQNGIQWLSNPSGRDADPLAGGDTPNKLSSQVFIRYTVLDGGYEFEKNSFSDAVEIGQYGFYSVENGIGVTYEIGAHTKTYLFPSVISASRFEAFCSKLDEESATMLAFNYTLLDIDQMDDESKAVAIKNYPALQDHPLYVLGGASVGEVQIGEFLAVELDEYFQEAGYTQQDLEADNKENGIETETEENRAVKLSVEYVLDENGFTARIPKDSIVYDSKVLSLMEVSLLPYFGTGSTQDEGYLFIPDGSGALIRFNNHKTNIPSYKKRIYGADYSVVQSEKTDTASSKIHLPVFGIQNNEVCFLAILEQGDAVAYINAEVSGRIHSFNAVYPSFQLKEKGVIEESVLNVSGSTLYQKKPFDSDLQVRYLFPQETGYVGMAHTYQNYLQKKEKLTNEPVSGAKKLPLYLETIGTADYTELFLGMIPVNGHKNLTTYEQARSILEDLKGAGIDSLILGYTGWANGGIRHSLFDRLKPMSNLGGKKGLEALTDYLKENEIFFYPQVDFQYISNDNLLDGFRHNRDSAQSLLKEIAVKYSYDLATMKARTEKQEWILSPSKYESVVDKFLKSAKEYFLSGLDVGTLSTDIVSDFSEKNLTDRAAAQQIITKQLSKLGETYRLSAEQANAYALANASVVKKSPQRSGGHYLLDTDIPFYQMVLHGFLPYTTDALNLSDDLQHDLLLAVETGSMPYFQVIYENNSALKDTNINLYSVSYTSWKDTIVSLYNGLERALTECQGCRMTAHIIHTDTLRQVQYENGRSIYVNYGTDAVQMNGVEVPAGGFRVIS